MEPVFGSELTKNKRAEFEERLRTFPHEYVAQERVALSTAPVWEDNRLNSRRMVLRTYVLNTTDGWVAIPGGLVRVAEADGSVVSMQQGGHSKDAWVLSDEPVRPFTMLRPRAEPLELRRVSRVVPSRVADNTFWLGRYVERSENVARILRSMIPRIRRREDAELGSLVQMHSCLGTRHSKLPRSKRTLPTFPAFEKELLSMLKDQNRSDSLPCILEEVARTGGNVRERLSVDIMLLINRLRDAMNTEAGHLPEFSAMLTDCLELLSAFSGMERENINRGSGWLFMSLGRRLERAIYITRELRVITRPLAAENWSFLEFLLEVADSSVTYRTRYYTTLQPLAVLDVLMADETNPRSLDFQLDHMAELYEKLPRHDPDELHAMQNAVKALRSINLQAIKFPLASKPDRGQHSLARLDKHLAELENLLPTWSNNLSTRYFSHARTLPTTMGQ
jgi:uncharacterized alpha-E superfamily protein